MAQAAKRAQPVPRDRVGFLLALAGGLSVRNFNRVLEPVGLRSRHHTVLAAAADSGGMSQRELADFLGVDPSAVVALVDDLERAGLVRRDPHPDDRRTRLIVLTRKGSQVYRKTAVLARKVDAELLSVLTAAERKTLEELLSRVVSVDLPPDQ